MLKAVDNIKQVRIFLLEMISGLTVEQLNEAPAGFNNNIIWNLAHMVSAQQGICYTRAGVQIRVDDQYFTPYRPGTKPEKFVDATQVDEIKTLLLSTIDQLQTDIDNNLMVNYQPWTARYGVAINSIEEAIEFLPFHEGLHISAIQTLRRFISK